MAAAAEHKLPLDPKYDQYDFPTSAPEPQSGHPGHTTPEQDAKVHQLRSALEQLGYTERLDTLTILRFLRARKFDVEAAKTMYVRSCFARFWSIFFLTATIVLIQSILGRLMSTLRVDTSDELHWPRPY